MAKGLTGIINQLEQQKAAIERALDLAEHVHTDIIGHSTDGCVTLPPLASME